MEGNLRFKINWASLIVGGKFTVFALFYFVLEGNFQVQAPPWGGGGAYIWRGNLTEGFFALRVWGPCIWRGLERRGLFSEFYGITQGGSTLMSNPLPFLFTSVDRKVCIPCLLTNGTP